MKNSGTKNTYFLILFINLAFFLNAQNFAGDKYFKKRLYLKAKESYLNELKKNLNPLLYIRIAETEFILQEYQKSVEYYSKAYPNSFNKENDYLNYAMSLKITGDYDKASVIYEEFLKKYPQSENYKKAKKFCAEIKYWKSRPIEYEISNCENINTPKSEFSSTVFDKKLFFSAERNSFNFVVFNKDESMNRDFYDIFYSELNSMPKKIKTFSAKLNSDYHEAYLSISEDGKKAAFTRTDNSTKGKLKKPQIYVAEYNNHNLRKIKKFEHNQEEYIFSHPSINKNGSILFFVSDMPGGYGGTDIWISEFNGSSWTKPVNAGPDINTPGNEMFPYIRYDETLFFSSDGHPGFGGLDIYSAKRKNGVWILEKHETMNLNSSYDDFGICFLNDSIGYFTSNRPGGKGLDDIYQFKYKNKFIEFSGYVLNTDNPNDPAKNVKVTLKDTTGNLIQETITDNNGYFIFKNLDADKVYLAYIDNPDPSFSGKARYYMTDNDKTIHRISSRQSDHPFVFKNLPILKNALPELYTDDNLTLAGNLLYGENPSKPLKNTKIRIKNEFGDVVEETTTNEFGAFTFKYLPVNQSYMVEIVETDVQLSENTKITLTNKSGKELKNFYYQKNKHLFKILPAEKSLIQEMYASDDDLIMDLSGYMYDQNKKPLANIKFTIFNQKNPLDKKEITTGGNGKFEFKNLDAEKNYYFSTDENDPKLNGVEKIFIADSRGRIFKVLNKDAKGAFVYKILPADKTILGQFVVDDPWLQVLELKNKKQKESLTIVENIYYGLNDYKFDQAGRIILDKVIQILKDNPNLNIELSSHTDSRAGDAYNLKLSQKRAQYAVDYIISRGVDKKRLKAIGFGETKLLNRCANGVECSEDEHKINRRTEFKIVDTKQASSIK
jgi:outer membrane protein OmpA-like peptidoglycan-associated protein/tetratricopeptide (TPR) repeat protein